MLEVNKVYNLDCINGLKQLDDNCIDFILTDPPFNVDVDYGKSYNDNGMDIEYYHWCYSWMKELYRVLKDGSYGIIFTGDKKLFYIFRAVMDSGLLFHHFLKWNKPHGQRALSGTVFFNRTELAFVVSKGKPNTKKINRKVVYADTIVCKNTTPNDKFGTVDHNCRRPVDLYRRIIKGFTDKEEIVLDCFMGSGTTAMACKQCHRGFIGFEINPDYVEISDDRIKSVPKSLDNWVYDKNIELKKIQTIN